MKKKLGLNIAVMAASALFSWAACAAELTVYSGRGEAFVAPVLKGFEESTGITLKVRYGGTAELSALLQEEKGKTPADVFWAQDSGALGSNTALFAQLPQAIYANQPEVFRNAEGKWVGVSARARTVAYSPERAPKESLPPTVQGLTDAKWQGKVGWAPGNAAFQAFVTAFRVIHGEDAARSWVQDMAKNGTKSYRNNSALVQAVADGEIDVALVNNYYLPRFKTQDAKFPVEQAFFQPGDIGNVVNTSGVAILQASDAKDDALKLVQYLLSPAVQQYLTSVGHEYPVVSGVIGNQNLESVRNVTEASPVVPTDKLTDLEGTRAILRAAGLI